MDVTRPAVIGLGLVAGAVAAIGTYAAVAPAPTPVHAKEVVSTSQAAFTPKPRPTVVTYAPCVAPAKLVGQECVTRHVVTTVVTPPPAPQQRVAASQPRAAAPAAPAVAPNTSVAVAEPEHDDEPGDEPGDDHDGDEGGAGDHPGDD